MQPAASGDFKIRLSLNASATAWYKTSYTGIDTGAGASTYSELALLGARIVDLPAISVIAITNGDEADGSPAVFEFKRTGDTSAPLTLNYRLYGTAQAGSDYLGETTGSITFAAGSQSTNLSLAVIPDSLVDPGETIIAQISPSSFYTIIPGKQTSTATITSDGVAVVTKILRRGSQWGGMGKGRILRILRH